MRHLDSNAYITHTYTRYYLFFKPVLKRGANLLQHMKPEKGMHAVSYRSAEYSLYGLRTKLAIIMQLLCNHDSIYTPMTM